MRNKSTKALPEKQLLIRNIIVELTRKNVKNINLRVTQPEGKVKVSAPKRMPVVLIQAFVISKYGWILKQQKRFQAYENENALACLSGEHHFFFGKLYQLDCIHSNAKPKVVLTEQLLELYINQEATREQRQSVLDAWYRAQLKIKIPDLISKYELLTHLKVEEFGVKKMKTRWGTCNPKAKRIWLNLELAKRPIECLEYVVLHEMAHFLETKHNQRFYDFVAEYIPDWKVAEGILSLPQ